MRNKCDCGRKMSKNTSTCKTCLDARLKRAQDAAQSIVAGGRCPHCAAPLRRNLAITGWWQCSQYGAETFRARADLPSCSYQTFTA